MNIFKNILFNNRVSFIYAALALQLGLYCFLFWPDYGQAHVQRFIFVAVILSACWVFTLYLIGAGGSSKRVGKHFSRNIGRNILIAGLIAGALFRVAVVWGAGDKTYLSDDVYRYVWDGRLMSEGLNPLAISPDDAANDPELIGLIDEGIHGRVNHPDFPSIYPPISQYLFFASNVISDTSVYGFKIVSLFFDLLTLVALWALLRVKKLPEWYVLIYWLAPLALLEFSLSSHQDILLLPFLTLALLFEHRKQAVAAAAFLTLAILTKFIVALAAPALALAFVGRERLKFIGSGLLVGALVYAPFWFLLSPPELFGSLFDYLGQWQYNGSIYTLFERGLSLATESSSAIARGIVTTLLLVTLGTITFRVADKVQAAFLCLIAYAALTTTLFPWYLVVFFPFITLYRGGAVIALMSLVWFSYWGLIGQIQTGFWYDNWWLRTLEYLPFYALLALGAKYNTKHKLLAKREGDNFAL